jgi:hypothetical protein
MSRTKNIARPDLQIPVEAWGTIKSATAKLTWFEHVDAAIAAGMVGGSFAQLAINIATNPKGVNSQTGLTWRSARTLADETGLTKSTVKRLLEEAVAAGLLFVVQKGRPGRDGQSTIYRLAMPKVGNGPPVRRFQRKKRPTHETKNSENGPSVPPETAHPCPRKRPTSGTHLLRDSISVENNLRVAAEGGATTARGDSSNTTRAVRESADGSSAVPEPLTPDPRADARTEPDEHQSTSSPPNPSRQSPHRNNPEASIGRAAAHADGAHDLAEQFESIKRLWPPSRVGDRQAAFRLFRAVRHRHSQPDVMQGVHTVMIESEEVPPLAEALEIAARRLEPR